MPFDPLESTDTTDRPWSPYRRDEVVIHLSDTKEDWDPVMKTEYLASLEAIAPADALMLQMRCQVLNPGVDISPETSSPDQ